jgi:hypothetical protein
MVEKFEKKFLGTWWVKSSLEGLKHLNKNVQQLGAFSTKALAKSETASILYFSKVFFLIRQSIKNTRSANQFLTYTNLPALAFCDLVYTEYLVKCLGLKKKIKSSTMRILETTGTDFFTAKNLIVNIMFSELVVINVLFQIFGFKVLT